MEIRYISSYEWLSTLNTDRQAQTWTFKAFIWVIDTMYSNLISWSILLLSQETKQNITILLLIFSIFLIIFIKQTILKYSNTNENNMLISRNGWQ